MFTKRVSPHNKSFKLVKKLFGMNLDTFFAGTEAVEKLLKIEGLSALPGEEAVDGGVEDAPRAVCIANLAREVWKGGDQRGSERDVAFAGGFG
jgi:hypothetical protein